MPEMKLCPLCNEEKGLLQFHRSKDSPDGHDRYCANCRLNRYTKPHAERARKLKQRRRDTRDRSSKKVCDKCKTPKPLTDFHKSASGHGGRDRYCAKCRNEMVSRNRVGQGMSVRGSPWKDKPDQLARDREATERTRLEEEARDQDIAAMLHAQRLEIAGR